MNDKYYSLLIKAAEGIDAEFVPYVGRGMRGRACPSLTLDGGDHLDKILDLTVSLFNVVNLDSYEFEETIDVLKKAKMDSMGLDVVVYWPLIKWEDFVDSEDVDDDESEGEE